uniref:uncharacterized protein LOC124035324 n=1 Tax=Oncorhynchus gorbuscha TaxID=8017 RepID=UPI001EAF6792|nr:uncharacterized protein LOC124035324 [Oncorhynchus gorbuscha]
MNPPIINSTNSVTTSTKRKREAERSVNWTVEETQVLLCAWSDEQVQKSLAENVRNRHVFKHLSTRMCDLGFSRSPHQCRLRVKTLKANYVRAKLLRSVDDSQPCSFRYYAEMDAVLGRNCAVDGMGGGCHFGSPEGIGGLGGGLHFGSEGIRGGGRHFGSPDRIVGGRHFGSVDGIGTEPHSGSPEGIGGRQSRYLVSEVKVEEEEEEDREAEDTDDYESNSIGINGQPLAGSGGRRHDVFIDRLNVYHEPVGHPLEVDLSSRCPSPHHPHHHPTRPPLFLHPQTLALAVAAPSPPPSPWSLR